MNSMTRRDGFKSLELDAPTLDQHFASISAILRQVTGKRHLALAGSTDTTPVFSSLVGEDCQYVDGGARGSIPVAPLVHLKDDLCAWIAVSGQWDPLKVRSRRHKRKFRFISLSLSIYFGAEGNVKKLLMFRAEWAGSQPADDGGYTFQPPTAGHPHWHYDALSSLVSNTREFRDRNASIAPPQDAGLFDTYDIDSLNRIFKTRIDRIHFASGAAWWKSESAHFHTPTHRGELESWAQGCATYMKNELRLLFRPSRRNP